MVSTSVCKPIKTGYKQPCNLNGLKYTDNFALIPQVIGKDDPSILRDYFSLLVEKN